MPDREPAQRGYPCLAPWDGLGSAVIDAAEMYHAEELAGQQCMGAGARRCQHVISDPCPSDGTEQAFGRSLWVASICISALDKTLSFFGDSPRLAGRGQEGAILQWGMSNPDVAGTEDSLSLPQGKYFAVVQALYDSEERVIGYGLVPWCSRRGIPVMAYVPMGDRRFGNMPPLREIPLAGSSYPVRCEVQKSHRLCRKCNADGFSVSRRMSICHDLISAFQQRFHLFWNLPDLGEGAGEENHG